MVNLIVKKKKQKKNQSAADKTPNNEILDYNYFPVKETIRTAVVSVFYHKSKT